MQQVNAPPCTESADREFQDHILPLVSRTFALTIPQLPPDIATVVGNAYLLCRIADTIEDDPELHAEKKSLFLANFLAVLRGRQDAAELIDELNAALAASTSMPERELILNIGAVVRLTNTFSPSQRQAVIRCVTTMCQGMPEYQHQKTLHGLGSLEDLDRYCYVVAGVVGEMLTELFCDYCEDIATQRDKMMELAACFGQGLQMTNILKDIWEDREKNTCWLPRTVFSDLDGGLHDAMSARRSTAVSGGIETLVGIAHAHLQQALIYTQTIPKQEKGIRRFCLGAIGMAMLTLRKIHRNPGYRSGLEVKISRLSVRAVVAVCNIGLYSNRALALLFSWTGRHLPNPPAIPLAHHRKVRIDL